MSIWLEPPVVKHIDVSGFTSQPGSLLSVHAKDDLRVATVHFCIHSAAGKSIEQLEKKIPESWTFSVTIELAEMHGKFSCGLLRPQHVISFPKTSIHS